MAAFPSPATAADTTIGFDDLSAGTLVSDQYKDLGGTDRGVVFASAPPLGAGLGERPRVAEVGGYAHSGTHVAVHPTCNQEFCSVDMWGRFPYAKDHVAMYVGNNDYTPSYHSISLHVFDEAGNELADPVTRTVYAQSPFDTPLSIYLPAQQIVYFRLEIAGHAPLGLDDLNFDNPAIPPAPRFNLKARQALINPGTSGGVVQGQTQSIPIDVSRANKSTGNVHLSVDPASLPKGVTASFSPADTDDPAGATVILNLKAASDAPEQKNVPVRVTGTPVGAQAGDGPRTITIPVSVEAVDTYDIQVNGIEVTQAVQARGPDDDDVSGLGSAELPQRNPANPSAPVSYEGKQTLLVHNRKTVVRVYVNNGRRVPFSGMGADVLLYGYDQAGRPLPDSPLLPDAGPGKLTNSGSPFVKISDRTDSKSSFNFTLPAAVNPGYGEPGASKRAWAAGRITLRAVATGPNTPVLGECTGCAADNAFTLSGIPFYQTGSFTVIPLRMQATGGVEMKAGKALLGSPSDIFAGAAGVLPIRLYTQDYAASFDVGGIANDPNRSNAGDDALTLVEDWDDDNGLSRGDYAVGVANFDLGATEGKSLAHISHAPQLYKNARPHSVVDGSTRRDYRDGAGNLTTPPPGAALFRPLTSVAHELGHGLGRPHASEACGGGDGGQTGEPWPFDQRGYIHGIGLDVSGAGSPGYGLYRTFGPLFYDYMSYCASAGNGDPDTWTSDRGWSKLIQDYADKPYPHAVASQRRFASATRQKPVAGGRRLRVAAFIGPGGTRTSFVKPSTGLPLPKTASQYHLVGIGAGGKAGAQSPMLTTTGHVDRAGGGAFTFVRGDVPAAGLAGVEIVSGGHVLKRVMRTPNAPKLALVAPTHRTRVVCKGTVNVRWHGSDADGGLLRAKVDYSADGGSHWRTIFVGRNKGHAALPGRYFTASRKARVRVRLNDGFNETARASRTFRAAGCGPTVHIISPAKGRTVRADAALYLSGEALEDGAKRVTGKRLRWYSGKRLLGSGETLSVLGLPRGRNRLRLVARDSHGRKGTASTTVRIKAVAPKFVRLQAPRTLGRKARHVKLVVESSLKATLRIGSKRYSVKRVPKHLTVRVKPGKKPLKLTLRLSAYGRTAHRTLVIRRP
jgi:hypothetical protein